MTKAEIAQRIVNYFTDEYTKNKDKINSYDDIVELTKHSYADIISIVFCDLDIFIEEKSAKNKGRNGHKIKKIFLMKKLNRILRKFCNLGILIYDVNNNLFFLSKIAIPILIIDDVKIDDKTIEDIYNFTEQINDRQYRSYNWNDSKIQNLLTIGSAVSAGILFALQFLSNLIFTVPAIVCMAIAFSMLLVSMLISLIHCIPKLNSKVGGNEDNLRTLIGFKRYVSLQKILGQKEDNSTFYPASSHYFDNIKQLKPIDRLRLTAYQCLGMGKNNIRSEKIIRFAVIAMIIAIIFMFLSIMFLAIANFKI